MQIEISPLNDHYVRLAVVGSKPMDAALFRQAVNRLTNYTLPRDATYVDILALGWYHTCRSIESRQNEEYEIEKNVRDQMFAEGAISQQMLRPPLSWLHNGQTFDDIQAMRNLIPSAKEQAYDLGTFSVGGDRIRVTDPCYDVDTWCAGVIENVRPGTWHAQSVMSNENDWGTRVKMLRIRHAEAPADVFEKGTFTKTDLHVGVDSGQAGFFDAARYPTDPDEMEYVKGRFYGDCCELTLDHSRPGGGVIPKGFGVVTSSGYGDGGYACHTAQNAHGQVIAAFITFIGDDEEEDEEREEL